MAGLPGTGKSTLAAELAAHLRAAVVDKDRLRPALFTRDSMDYSREQDDFCFTVMLHLTALILHRGHHRVVILDGRTCTRAYQVRLVRSLAHDLRQPLQIIECVCDDATAANRLRHDHCTGRHPAANRTYALYLKLKAHAEPIPPPKLVIDSTRSLPVTVTRCLNHLTQQPTRAAWPTRPQPASTT